MSSKIIWDAEDYENNSSNQKQWADEIISKLNFKGNETILDIGCGDGKNTARIAREVAHGKVIGIDSSEKMLVLARERYLKDQYSNLEFQYGDASRLNYFEEFDIAVSFACLHWVNDHLQVLNGIRNSLKIGGRTYLQFGGKGNAAPMFEIANDMMADNRWEDYFTDFKFPYSFYHPDEYLPWVEKAGLNIKRLELIPKTARQSNKKGLKGWVRTTWIPYLERIPAELHDEFLDELTDKYLESYPPDENGAITVPMMRLEVEAEREK
jgi:trans-aconitate methyltransferase